MIVEYLSVTAYEEAQWAVRGEEGGREGMCTHSPSFPNCHPWYLLTN